MIVGSLSAFLFCLCYFRKFNLDKMSVLGYSTCRIQFIPNDKQRGERNYSDRSLLQLKQYDFGDYSLSALDIANKNEV
jgi:hypothetical protein